MDTKEMYVYGLWIAFLILFFTDLFGIGRNLSFVPALISIFLSNKLENKKKGKILSWISFGIVVLALFLGFGLFLVTGFF